MDNPLISIIVPIYNMERYLERCIRCIINQTYDNIEILLIDDGSTDNSLSICKNYARKDPRIKVFSKKNGGQGSARNLGLDYANGDYIGFVDPDDWIEKDMYESLLLMIKNENAEIAQIGWLQSSSDEIKPINIKYKTYSFSSREALNNITFGKGYINTSVCSKLFCKNIIGKLRFTEVYAYEDDEFVFKSIWNSKKIVINQTPKYIYFIRENSTMTSNFNEKKLALITIQKNICNFVKDKDLELYYYHEKFLCSKQFYMLSCLLKSKNIPNKEKYISEIIFDLNHNYCQYMRNKRMGKNKIILFIIKFFPKLLWQRVFLFL